MRGLPFATLILDWFTDGDELVLEAPPVQEIVPEQEQYVFRQWTGEGAEGVTVPRATGLVTSPGIFAAIYERQVMVTVDSPHGGAGGGWHRVGSTVTVIVPREAPSAFLFKKSFVRFSGHAKGQSSVQVLVQEPTVVSAVYQTSV